MESAKTLVSAFVTSRLDYCNGVLPGLSQKQIEHAVVAECGGTDSV